MEVSGQDDAPAVLPQENFPGAHWVEVRVSLDDLEKIKNILHLSGFETTDGPACHLGVRRYTGYDIAVSYEVIIRRINSDL